ncbi:MAG TPA: very short patch repair endonuclease [Planctomycetota bacterium]|nr:very short patch repair endonuclease [Planctomycetota bacterium]
MADIFTKAKRSQIMAAIKSVGNRSTEQALASAFRRLGVKGWRRHVNLPGKPDFVFRKQRLAVFVDGCFWHNCPKHGHIPKSNRKYWRKKLERNQERDRAANRELRRKGWRVLRLWEHAAKVSPIACAGRVARALLKSPCVTGNTAVCLPRSRG